MTYAPQRRDVSNTKATTANISHNSWHFITQNWGIISQQKNKDKSNLYMHDKKGSGCHKTQM